MKEVFLVGGWINTPEKLETVYKLVTDLKKLNFPIIFTSHHTIPEELQEKVIYAIYDENNPMSDKVRLLQIYGAAGVIVQAPWEENYHATAGMSALQNGVDFCKGRFDRIYWQEYDVSYANLDLYIQKVREYNKPFCGFNWLGDKNSLATNVYAVEINHFQDIWKYPIYDVTDYLKNVYYSSQVDGVESIITEAMGIKLLKISGLDYHIFSEEEQREVLASFTLHPAPSEHATTKVWVCYANDHKIMLFIINHTSKLVPISIKSKYMNLEYTALPMVLDEAYADGRTKFVDVRWWLLERVGTMEITFGDKCKTYDFEQLAPINEATFRFENGKHWQE